jgi:recombination protein RecT
MNELTVLQRDFEPLLPRLEAALGANIVNLPVNRLMQTIVVSCERNPKLLAANRQSLFNAALTFAFLGLEVDGVTGQGYLIPFKGYVQPVIGYKGYNTLAARSGISLSGQVVREGDDFKFELGTNAMVLHVPAFKVGAKVTHAWAAATHNERPPVVEVLGIGELLEVKRRSPGAQMKESPWNDPAIGFFAMCSKTAKRRLARMMPLNVMQHASRLEEAFEEQGRLAYIDPAKGVIVAPDPVHEPTSTMLTQSPPDLTPQGGEGVPGDTPASSGTPAGVGTPTLHTQLTACRARLEAAAALGTTELQRTWVNEPVAFRANLDGHFSKVLWPDALLADRKASEEDGRI